MVNNICAVSRCGKESYPGCGLTFHSLPSDLELKKKWFEVIPGNLSESSVVCSLHFKPEDYRTEARKRLKPGAIPSIFPMPPDKKKKLHYHRIGSVSQSCMNPDCDVNTFELHLEVPILTSDTEQKNEFDECEKQLKESTEYLNLEGIGNSDTEFVENEDMCIIKQEEIEIADDPLDNPLCGACLGQGRSLQPLGALAPVYCALVPHETDVKAVKICEGCAATLLVCAEFQEKAVRARIFLQACERGQYMDINNTKMFPTLQTTSALTTVPEPTVKFHEIEIKIEKDTSAMNVETELKNDPVEQQVEIKSTACMERSRKKKKTDGIHFTEIFRSCPTTSIAGTIKPTERNNEIGIKVAEVTSAMNVETERNSTAFIENPRKKKNTNDIHYTEISRSFPTTSDSLPKPRKLIKITGIKKVDPKATSSMNVEIEQDHDYSRPCH